jgi:hypothetical protein
MKKVTAITKKVRGGDVRLAAEVPVGKPFVL